MMGRVVQFDNARKTLPAVFEYQPIAMQLLTGSIHVRVLHGCRQFAV